MKKFTYLRLFTLLPLTVLECGHANVTQPTANATLATTLADKDTNFTTMPDAIQQFNSDFYQQIKQQNKSQDNVFYSPFSLYTALGMVYQGAQGRTASEMATVLHAKNPTDLAKHSRALLATMNQKDLPYVLNTVNALWVEKNTAINPQYQKVINDDYLAHVTRLDFLHDKQGSIKIINDHIAEHTHQKIQNLLSNDAINADTRLILTNAVYFKGRWQKVFDKDATKPAPFHVTPQQTMNVPMMYQKSTFEYGENAQLQILSLPYQGDNLRMLVVLPRENQLSNVEKSISVKNLATWRGLLSSHKVEVYLPKFKLETKYNLVDTLHQLGMPTAFSNQADFSGISKQANLSLSDVVHQAFVEVNETGTEAAAVTRATLFTTSAVLNPPPPKIFRADRPFIFMIEDSNNGNILFMGKVMNPNQ